MLASIEKGIPIFILRQLAAGSFIGIGNAIEPFSNHNKQPFSRQ